VKMSLSRQEWQFLRLQQSISHTLEQFMYDLVVGDLVSKVVAPSILTLFENWADHLKSIEDENTI
jgi:hypothetical protein